MPSTRDFKKSIDLTGLSDVSGSEMNQLIDVGRAYDDKGLVIVTTDTALNTPDTPNPNLADGMGITPTWWKNYIWIRKPFNNTSVVKVYVWNDLIPDAGTLLKWVYQNQTAEDALAAANGAQITANEAKTDADAANTALAVLDNRVTNTETDIDNLQATDISLSNRVDTLESSSGQWESGDLKWTAADKTYLTTEDQGWLQCDGASIERAIFPNLFAAIGTMYGAADDTHFSLPDLRGRVAMGDGTGIGLTARTISQKPGNENHLLTGQQSGIQQHHHNIQHLVNTSGAGSANNTLTFLAVGNNYNTDDIAHTNALQAHNNIQPSLVLRPLIKT
jgi:microcystin-dependent protein